MRQIIWTCVLWLAACDIPADVKLEMSCSTLCTCFAGPIGVDRCVDECIEEGDLALIPDDCFECIQQHSTSCSTLEQACEPICDSPRPPPDLPDGGMQ